MWYSGVAGATLQMFGTWRDSRSMSAMVKATPPSRAAASRCRTVFVEPPMAMSSVIAFSKARNEATPRGSTLSSPSS